jgi:hypothetical protein
MKILLIFLSVLSSSTQAQLLPPPPETTTVIAINGNQEVPQENDKMDYVELLALREAFSSRTYRHRTLYSESNTKDFTSQTKGKIILDENLADHLDLSKAQYHQKIKDIFLNEFIEAKKKNQALILFVGGHGINKPVDSKGEVVRSDNGTYKPENACIALNQKKFLGDGSTYLKDIEGSCITFKEVGDMLEKAGYGTQNSPKVKIMATACYGGGASYITNRLANVCGGWFGDESSPINYNYKLGTGMLNKISAAKNMSLETAFNEENISYGFNDRGGLSSDFYISKILKDKNLSSLESYSGFEQNLRAQFKNSIEHNKNKEICPAPSVFDFKIPYQDFQNIIRESLLQNMLYSEFIPKNVLDYYVKVIDMAITRNEFDLVEYKRVIERLHEHSTFFSNFHKKSDQTSQNIMKKHNQLKQCESENL